MFSFLPFLSRLVHSSKRRRLSNIISENNHWKRDDIASTPFIHLLRIFYPLLLLLNGIMNEASNPSKTVVLFDGRSKSLFMFRFIETLFERCICSAAVLVSLYIIKYYFSWSYVRILFNVSKRPFQILKSWMFVFSKLFREVWKISIFNFDLNSIRTNKLRAI